MSERGREALSNVREWSGSSNKCPRVVGRPTWMYESGREAIRMFGNGRDALPDVREWSEAPPGCPGEVNSPSCMSGSGRKALPDVREWSAGSHG